MSVSRTKTTATYANRPGVPRSSLLGIEGAFQNVYGKKAWRNKIELPIGIAAVTKIFLHDTEGEYVGRHRPLLGVGFVAEAVIGIAPALQLVSVVRQPGERHSTVCTTQPVSPVLEGNHAVQLYRRGDAERVSVLEGLSKIGPAMDEAQLVDILTTMAATEPPSS